MMRPYSISSCNGVTYYMLLVSLAETDRLYKTITCVIACVHHLEGVIGLGLLLAVRTLSTLEH